MHGEWTFVLESRPRMHACFGYLQASSFIGACLCLCLSCLLNLLMSSTVLDLKTYGRQIAAAGLSPPRAFSQLLGLPFLNAFVCTIRKHAAAGNAPWPHQSVKILILTAPSLYLANLQSSLLASQHLIIPGDTSRITRKNHLRNPLIPRFKIQECSQPKFITQSHTTSSAKF